MSTNNKEVWIYNADVGNIRDIIKQAGNTIGSVHFNKRSDGQLRKMSYRLHVKKPSVARAPKGDVKDDTGTKLMDSVGSFQFNPNGVTVIKMRHNRKDIDLANNQMTILDCNKVVRDENGAVKGRGAWRTIPLETVTQVTVKGVKYVIKNGETKAKITK